MTLQQTYFKNIADTIRSLINSNELIKPKNFPTKINEVFVLGRKAHYDDFWDSFQDCGRRTNYTHGFCGLGFNDTTFKPKYNIIPYGYTYMPFASTNIKNLKVICELQNIVIDFSHADSGSYLFYNSAIETVGEVNITGYGNLSNLFASSTNLTTIDNLVLRSTEGQIFYPTTFSSCTKLENLTIQGKIFTDIDLHWSSRLTHNSLVSIIDALYNNANSKTLTIGQTNINKLSQTDIARITQKGWSIA